MTAALLLATFLLGIAVGFDRGLRAKVMLSKPQCHRPEAEKARPIAEPVTKKGHIVTIEPEDRPTEEELKREFEEE